MHSSITWQLDNWCWIGWLLDLQKYLKLIIVNIFMGYKNRKISPQIATCLFTIRISQWAVKYMKHANSFLSLQMRWRTYYGSLGPSGHRPIHNRSSDSGRPVKFQTKEESGVYKITYVKKKLLDYQLELQRVNKRKNKTLNIRIKIIWLFLLIWTTEGVHSRHKDCADI